MERLYLMWDFLSALFDWKFMVAISVAAIMTFIQAVLRKERLESAAWEWAGSPPGDWRLPPPQDILDGCKRKIRNFVFRGSSLAKRMEECGLHDESRIFNRTERVLTSYFQNVLDGADLAESLHQAKELARIAGVAADSRRCHERLGDDLWEWSREVGAWTEIVRVVGVKAADELRLRRGK